MSDVSLLVAKPGTLSPPDRDALRAAGVVVIEAKRPQDVRFLRAGVEVDAGQMLRAAIKAIAETKSYDSVSANFVRYLNESLINGAKEEQP